MDIPTIGATSEVFSGLQFENKHLQPLNMYIQGITAQTRSPEDTERRKRNWVGN
jgi:hypothetical protein